MQLAANLSLLFTEHPLLDRFAAARQAGFTAVEVQFPYAEAAEAVARARERAGVTVVLINAPVIDGRPAGFAARPDLTGRFREALAQAREYAEALDTRLVNVLAGQAEPGEAAACRATLADNLRHAADALAGCGARPLLEVLNPQDVPAAVVGDFVAARAVLAACDGAAGLLFDLYHAAMLGLEPDVALAEQWDLVEHVQFADAPGRGEPGSGAVRLEAALDVLRRHGYGGYVSAEYRPTRTTAQSLAWLAAWRERLA